ncbi:hypothetical protein C8J57DRAFT_1004659, partial [Mycena rebaudengoi]
LALPNEITSEILVHFLPTYPNRALPTGPSSPELLGQICRQWRDISLSTPRLWCALSLDLYDGRRLKRKLRLLKNWLKRSGTCPLSISLRSESTGNREFSSADFIAALSLHCSRWEEMEFILPYGDLRLVHGAMPLLRQLTIGPDSPSFGKGIPPGDNGTPPLILFHEAPKLSSVTLPDSFVPSAIVLPWAQLTSVFADAIYPYDCAEVLRHGTHLESVTFTMCEDPEEIDLQQIPPLVHLQSLVLLPHPHSAGQYQPPLLDALILPGLRTLQISLQGFDILTDPRVTVTSLITRSSCRLERL